MSTCSTERREIATSRRFASPRLGVSVDDGPPNQFRSPEFAPTLTAREMQVLASLMLGRTNREIGRELFIAESTVKAHVTSIFGKFGVSTRVEAAATVFVSGFAVTAAMVRIMSLDSPPATATSGRSC